MGSAEKLKLDLPSFAFSSVVRHHIRDRGCGLNQELPRHVVAVCYENLFVWLIEVRLLTQHGFVIPLIGIRANQVALERRRQGRLRSGRPPRSRISPPGMPKFASIKR
ncbi:hypothetical protein TCAP_06509 [Tolypocladium capitatum]|uniref:Uncharacterized protein n=1 Tax=Tolypocladium capitatum TaxID=45235 RepID=A0A2K3Q7N9_9HYPO|nr:hypothetical protein TCAP_06509 [Tolypocladium capitatum]